MRRFWPGDQPSLSRPCSKALTRALAAASFAKPISTPTVCTRTGSCAFAGIACAVQRTFTFMVALFVGVSSICVERRLVMKAWSVIGLLFGAAMFATIPISPQVTPSGVELSVDQAQAYYGHYRRVHRRVYRRAYRRGYYYGARY